MAVTTNAAPPRSAARGESAPAWVLVLYLGGLVLVYIGERVLSGLPKGSGFVSFMGVLFAVAATVLRFAPRFRAGGERRAIETQLAILSVLGLVGLLVYFATSDFGASKLGLDKLTSETRTKVEELARVLWVALIGISVVPMIFAETALLPMRHAERPESRRVRAAATSGLVMAMAVLYSALFVYVASSVDLKVDYSFFKTSRPSESTRKLAQSLSGDPIRVIAFFPDVNEVRKEVQSYLRDLASSAPKLHVEIKDRLLDPKLAQEVRAMQDGVIVLSRGSVHQSLAIGTELEQARPKLKTLDRDFQEQLLKIARSRQTAYLTVGHGEANDAARGRDETPRAVQVLRTLLQKQNYLVKDLGLGQGLANDVPQDADVVLVLGLTSPFTSEELASLKRYAERGGKLLLALEPEAVSAEQLVVAQNGETAAGATSAKPVTPAASPSAAASSAAVPTGAAAPNAAPSSNEELASLVGLQFVPDVLANEKQHVRLRYNDSDRTRLVTNSFSSHASVSTLSRNAPRAAVITFGAASLEKAPGSSDRVDFAVRSMSGTFRDANKNFADDIASERPGVFNIAAAVTRPIAGATPPDKSKATATDKDKKANDAKEMRAFVIADSDALSDFVMGEVLGNQVLFVDALRWLVGEHSIQGLPNTEEDVRIEHTKQGDLGWFYATIFGAPLFVLGTGLVISRRSRVRGGKR